MQKIIRRSTQNDDVPGADPRLDTRQDRVEDLSPRRPHGVRNSFGEIMLHLSHDAIDRHTEAIHSRKRDHDDAFIDLGMEPRNVAVLSIQLEAQMNQIGCFREPLMRENNGTGR